MSALKKTILSIVGNKVMPQMRIQAVDTISDHFRLIDLVSQSFEGAVLEPAAKIQIDTGNWEMRTYTPLSIDAETGVMRILAFIHGNGVGSTWARAVKPGDLTRAMGPRTSLDVMGLSAPAIFFGDETSFAAAKTVQDHLAPGNPTRLIFEVSSIPESQQVADRLELRDVEFFEKQDSDAHIPLVVQALQNAMGAIAASHLVLTGSGFSIQKLRTALRAGNAESIQYRVKAYWTPGKRGLD